MYVLLSAGLPDTAAALRTGMETLGWGLREGGAPDLIFLQPEEVRSHRAAHPHAVIVAIGASLSALEDGADEVLDWPDHVPDLPARLRVLARWTQRAAAARDRARGIADAASEGICVFADDRILYVNEVLSRINGLTPDQMEGRSFTEFISSEERERAAARLIQGELRAEIEFTRRDGVVMPIDVRIRDGFWDGRPARIATIRDLSGQKSREAADAQRDAQHREELQTQLRAIEESNARFSLVARATNDVLYDWDVRTGHILWNNALHTVLRFEGDPSAAGIQWWVTQMHPDDSERVSASLDRAMLTGAEGWSESYRFAMGNGTWLDIIDRGIFMRDAAGQCLRMIGAMMDITSRKQLQTRLVLADRLASVGTLAAGVAHELNNPLTWVLANVRLVQESVGHSLPEPARRALENAAQGAERMRLIVADLKVFSGNERHAVVPVDVRATLQSALSIVGGDLRARARLEHSDTTVGPLLVRGNEARLAQVLLNLLVNAVQAIEPGQPERNCVTVTVRTLGGRIAIDVSDTGCGIPWASRGRIFDPFYTTKPPGEGTGLGLSIGLQLVQEMGGSIALVPKPGRGTCFRVLLPACASPVATKPGPVSLAPVAGPTPARVLVVDDEEMIVEMLSQILTPEFDVVGEHRSTQALALLEQGERFDAILCDVMMPALNGMDLYRAVQALSPHQASRFIFVTGGVSNAHVQDFLAETGRPCVEKPFDLHTLREKVRKAANRK